MKDLAIICKLKLVNVMKYVKLFENWLNEADEVKFDASKPEATPVTSITQKDLFGSGVKDIEKNLKSILSRSLDKTETSDKPSESVTVKSGMTLVGFDGKGMRVKEGNAPGSAELLVKVVGFNKVQTNDLLGKIGTDVEDDSARVFVIYGKGVDESKVYWKEEKVDQGISTASASILILPKEPQKGDDPAITMQGVIISQGKPRLVNLGQVCAFASTNFSKEGVAMLDKEDSGKKESLMATVFKGSGETGKEAGPTV